MTCPPPLAEVFLYSVLSILFAQATPQSAAPASQFQRLHLKQDQLGCYMSNSENPIYPKKARLAHTEGVIKLILVIADNVSIAGVQSVSGDPLLVDSAIRAVRQWRFQAILVNGRPVEAEVPLSFTFTIQDPPKPAYLHLVNKKVIRADEVREFSDRIEYTVGRRTHHVSPDSVTAIDACPRFSFAVQPKAAECVPAGGPFFIVRAIPLLPAEKSSPSEP
jgi:TonB family protein